MRQNFVIFQYVTDIHKMSHTNIENSELKVFLKKIHEHSNFTF